MTSTANVSPEKAQVDTIVQYIRDYAMYLIKNGPFTTKSLVVSVDWLPGYLGWGPTLSVSRTEDAKVIQPLYNVPFDAFSEAVEQISNKAVRVLSGPTKPATVRIQATVHSPCTAPARVETKQKTKRARTGVEKKTRTPKAKVISPNVARCFARIGAIIDDQIVRKEVDEGYGSWHKEKEDLAAVDAWWGDD